MGTGLLMPQGLTKNQIAIWEIADDVREVISLVYFDIESGDADLKLVKMNLSRADSILKKLHEAIK